MKRYWTSWYSGNYEDEGCTAPPFDIWVTGYRARDDDEERDDCTICGVIDADNEAEVWDMVKKHFPDYKERFIEERPDGWNPNRGRFPKE